WRERHMIPRSGREPAVIVGVASVGFACAECTTSSTLRVAIAKKTGKDFLRFASTKIVAAVGHLTASPLSRDNRRPDGGRHGAGRHLCEGSRLRLPPDRRRGHRVAHP